MHKFEQDTENFESIADFIRYAATQFSRAEIYYGHGTDNSWDEAVALVLQMLELPHDYPQMMLSAKLSADERLHLTSAIKARVLDRKPLAYITNKAYFAQMEFYVDERVLVPRSPIAELIENQFTPWLTNDEPHILDLCSGSGCIGIACAAHIPDSEVVLSDISSDALEVAQINIDKSGLYPQVQAIESDLFSNLQDYKFDLIVSNPPYVDAEDLADMPDEFQHEPEIGLGSGEDGLELTRKILQQAANYLTEHGVLIVEVGNSWLALEAAYPQAPFNWLDFERGGEGIFLLTKQQLDEFFSD